MREQTEMERVRLVANMLLLSEIYETEYSPMIVQHPFTSTGFIMNPRIGISKILNIVQNESDLISWQEQMKKAIGKAQNPFEIYMMINKPYCLTFLKFAMPYLSRKDFSIMLADAWIRSENPNMDRNLNKEKLLSMFRQADKTELMDEREIQALEEMDEEITIYRGVTSLNAKKIRALSWTTNYETAYWFAHRFGEDGTVYEAHIKKAHIFAFFDQRNESEVIIDPKYLRDIQMAQDPEQSINITQ